MDIDQLGTIVAAQITAASASVPFSQTVTAEFDDQPTFTQANMATLRCSLIPLKFQPAPGKALMGQPKPHHFRGISQYQYSLSMCIQQAGPVRVTTLPDPVTAFSAGLRLLVQDIIRWLVNDRNRKPILDPQGSSLWLKTVEMNELYDIALLRNERYFRSFCTLNYEEFVRE